MKKRQSPFGQTGLLAIFCALEGSLLGITPLAQAAPSPNDESAVLAGRVEAARTVQIRAEVSQPVQITEMIPEGTTVKKGDLLMAFDDAALAPRVQAEEIVVEAAKARLAQAQRNLENAREGRTLEIPTLELRLKIAELARAEAVGSGGTLALDIAEAEAEIAVAGEQLQAAEQRFGDVGRMVESGRAERSELNRARITVLEVRHSLQLAVARKEYLEKRVRPLQEAAHELEILEARAALRRHELASKDREQAAEAELAAARFELDLQKTKLERLKSEWAASRVYAPFNGLVVRPGGLRGESPDFLRPGATVHPRQHLLTVHDTSEFTVIAAIPEAMIGRIKVGDMAAVRVDALPEKTFRGRVTGVTGLPSTDPAVGRPPRQASVTVSLDPTDQPLRPGLAARVEIVLDAGHGVDP